MTFKELAELVRTGPGVTVECRSGIEDFEGYPEVGMRARVVAVVAQGDDVSRLTLDYTDFDDFNKAFETANYYDKSGGANLTAREAGFYALKEDVYVTTSDAVENLFVLLEAQSLTLFEEYQAAKGGLGYTSWLEAQVLELRNIGRLKA